MRVRLFKADVPETRQIKDPFSELYALHEVIEPPYPLEELQKLPEMSNILRQAIDAYVTNLLGFGWTLVQTDPEYEPSEAEQKQIDQEYDTLRELFEYASPGGDIATILAKVIADRERTGNGYLEVIRDVDGKIVALSHVPAHTVRITPATEEQLVRITIPLPGREKTFLVRKRFRRFVQIVDSRKVYFKEFGDPRQMDYTTGEFAESVPFEKRATELIHFKIDSPTSVYGVPRYIGNLLAILGSRKAEELNYSYFLSGKHIPMAILVQNGFLSESSIEKLQEYLQSLGGVENAYKFLVLESVTPGDVQGAGSKIELKPLVDTLQQDALFIEYDAKNREKIRSAFRLPPLFVGETHEYNRATAEASYKVANEQVFRPLQKEIERIINSTIVADLGIRFWRFKLNTPELVDAKEVAQMIAHFNAAGGVSPNLARQILSKLLNEELPEYEGEWAELPLKVLEMRMKMGYDDFSTVEKRDPFSKLLDALKELRRHEAGTDPAG